MLYVTFWEDLTMWKVVQCSVQGKGHIKDFIPCQDKTYYYKKDNITVTALADGAGSAKLSHFGAEHITQFICNDLAENFDLYFSNEDGVFVKNELNNKIKYQLYKLAMEIKCYPYDLASTLLAVAVKKNYYILLHIGDGVIGYSKSNKLMVASKPENGEFINTTVFTTSKDTLQTMRLMKGNLNQINGFILMSDGTETSLYNKKENKLADVLGKIMHMMSFIPTNKIEAQLTDSFYSVIRNATTDDCSISIMVNCEDKFQGYLSLDTKSKKQLLQINPKAKSNLKQFRHYDEILIALVKPCSLREISKIIHLKPKYTKRHLSKLINMNLIERQGNIYRTIVIM